MSIVQSSGSLLALESSVSKRSWGPSGIADFSGLMADYAAIWRTQPQVRKVVGFLARNIAQLNVTLYRRVSATDRERLDDHHAARALAFPMGQNLDSKMSKTLFMETLVSDRCIYDNAYWLKLKNPGGTDEMRLIPLPPTIVTPMGPSLIFPDEYEVRGPKGTTTYAARDVVHFRGYNANDRRIGMSPIESLRQILAEDLASDSYREQTWRRGARISGVLERPATAPKWSEKAAERFGQEWRAAWTGDGPDTGGTPILEDGMEFKPTSFSARETQWLEAKKLTREEVAAAYHIPQPMVGLLDHATFSNVTELHKHLYQDTLPPWCVGIEEDIELQLLPEWDELVVDHCYVEFNLMEKLKGSFEEQARALQTFVGAPIMTRNEGRARLNLPALPPEVGDVLITPLNVLVGGQASPTDSAPPLEASAEITELVARFLSRCGRGVLGRWDRVVDGTLDIDKVWQGDRWGKELVDDLEAKGLEAFEELAASVIEHTRAAMFTALAASDPRHALRGYFGDSESRAASLVDELIEEATAP